MWKVKMNRCGKNKVARFIIEDSQEKIYEVSAFLRCDRSDYRRY